VSETYLPNGMVCDCAVCKPVREARQAAKAARFLEAYSAGDIKIGQVTGAYPNPSLLPDFKKGELYVIAAGRGVGRSTWKDHA
jgi:hypothetical protein